MLYAPVRFKGCDIGFAAFELAKKSVPHLRMVCLSDPEPPPGLPVGVEFVSRPSQDRIRDVYAACDAWLFCSRSEGFGLPILEAMKCGTPVVAGNRTSIPEVAGEAALLFDPFDVHSLVEALKQVLNDSEYRANLSAKGLQRANEFNWQRTARLTLAAYEKAAGK